MRGYFYRLIGLIGCGVMLVACTEDINLNRVGALAKEKAGGETVSTSGSPFALTCDGDLTYAPGDKLNLSCTPLAETNVSKFKIESTTCPSNFLIIDTDTGKFSTSTVPSSFEGCKVTVASGDGNTWCPVSETSCRVTFPLFHFSLIGDFDKSAWAGSSPIEFVTLNGKVYFFASYNNTMHLFSTDGTVAGTSVVTMLPGESSKPQNTTKVIGSLIYFVYGTTAAGRELWVSDGTQKGTRLVRDIYVGQSTSSISGLTGLNGIAYFRARNAENGFELWRSDGTESGTFLVSDICSPTCHGLASAPNSINGALYFSASDGNSGVELWKSDGTADGTFLLKDINPGSANSSPGNYTTVHGRFFFSATDAANGTELWKSDGTESGTMLVKDINPGAANNSAPSQFFNLNGTLIFTATDGSAGSELWKSDGTAAGTQIVADINSGSGSSFPFGFMQLGAFAYFQATSASTGYELWRTDGAAATLVADSVPGSGNGDPGLVGTANGRIFWRGKSTASGVELWSYDPASAADDAACVARLGAGALKSPTANGCYVMMDVNPGASDGMATAKAIAVTSTTLLFAGTTPEAGAELWKSDGTLAGTSMLKDLNPTADSFVSSSLIKIGQTIYIGVNDLINGLEPRIFDESTKTLSLLKDTAEGATSGGFRETFNFDGKPVWFTQSGQVWIYDPTVVAADDAACVAAKGTGFVKAATGAGCLGPLVTSNCCTSPAYVRSGDYLYFRAQLSGNGYEMWSSDGTQAGTRMVTIDASPASYDSSPNALIEFKGAIYISMRSYTGGVSDGTELWKYDPRPAADTAACVATHGAGFHRPSSGVPGCLGPYFAISGGQGRDPQNMVADENYLYFTANDPGTGWELYVTDGSAGGVQLVSDLSPGTASSSHNSLLPYKGRLYFGGSGQLDRELYMYNPSPAADDAACAARDGQGFVRASASGCIGILKDIVPGVDTSGATKASYPSSLTRVRDGFVFIAVTPEYGQEIWFSDGSASGTRLVKDINPGTTNSLFSDWYVVGDYLVFSISMPDVGRELWVTDGTAFGTRMLKEIYPGVAGTSFQSIKAIDKTLYFGANTPGGVGQEPWKLMVP